MQLSDEGFDLLKRSEGFRDRVYADVAGFRTIGYGHRLKADEFFPDGVTEAQACVLLDADVAFAEHCVNNLVHVPLTQGQFDALVDFTFNLGADRLASSTLLKYLNESKYDLAAWQLLSWDHAVVNGTVEEIAGLKARREAEYALWDQAPA